MDAAIATPAVSWFNKTTSSTLHYQFVPASENSSEPQILISFLNGLILPKISWTPAIEHLLRSRSDRGHFTPALLLYDRCGQGESPPSPLDADREPGHGHDCLDAVTDLQGLLEHVSAKYDLPPSASSGSLPPLIFVCNSIGCAIARLFAARHPGTVSGLVLLDSIIANSDFVSIWPDPDAAAFDPRALPDGVTPALLRETREMYGKVFHPSVPNREGLSRRNLARLLPRPDAPSLVGPDGKAGPYVTVVGHDWETFAKQSQEGSMQTPAVLTMAFTNPVWTEYNEGLLKITDERRRKGVVIAKGYGHFIQKDDPRFVADEISVMLSKVAGQST